MPVVGVIAPEAARRRPRHAQPAHRAARDAGDRHRRPLRGARPHARRRRPLHRGRLPEARAADRGGRADGRRRRASTPRRCKEAGCDTVILGCTHYPLIRPVLQRVFGRDVTLVFSAEETAREVADDARAQGLGERRAAARASTASSRPATRRSSASSASASSSCRSATCARVAVAELERAAA